MSIDTHYLHLYGTTQAHDADYNNDNTTNGWTRTKRSTHLIFLPAQ